MILEEEEEEEILPPHTELTFLPCTGNSYENDWERLLSWQPFMVKDIANFKHAIRLYYSNDEVTNYNFKNLLALNQPIAKLKSQHSSDMAKRSTPDEMSGLDPAIFLETEAHVMLPMSLWTDVAL